MKIVALGDRRVALGLTWFGRTPSPTARRQARRLARRLQWDGPLVFAERPGPIAQLGLTTHGASLPPGARALAPACVTTDEDDLLVLLRLDDETGWVLAARRGNILVHGDRIVPWEERTPVLEELRAHLEEPRTVVEDDPERSQALLETLARTQAPCLETVGSRPWARRGRWLALLPLTAACVLLVRGLGFPLNGRPRPPSPALAARLAFLRLWREGRSPAAWRRACLQPLLALPLVRRDRELVALDCTPDGLVVRYRPLAAGPLTAQPSSFAQRGRPGVVTLAAPRRPWGPLPLPADLNTPAKTDAGIGRLLALAGVHPDRAPWRPCLDLRGDLPEDFRRLRCRPLRVRLRREPEARLRLLLRALAPLPAVRVRRLVAHLSPPSWTLEATLYAENP